MTLLDPAKKESYVAELRAKLQAQKQAADHKIRQARPLVAKPLPTAAPLEATPPAPSGVAPSPAARGKAVLPLAIIGGAAVVILLLVAGGIAVMIMSSNRRVAEVTTPGDRLNNVPPGLPGRTTRRPP